MKNTVQPISRAEMARELERLKEMKVSDRYTVGDVALLTGWTREYLYKLEKSGVIPRAKRSETPPSGNPDFCKRGKLMPPRVWTDDQVRRILGFKRSQDRRFGRG